jgi:hypothetical protein
LSPAPEPDTDDVELPESPDEPDDPDEPDELDDFAASEPEDELPEDELSEDEPPEDEPLDPAAAPSLPAATVLDPFRLSVR